MFCEGGVDVLSHFLSRDRRDQVIVAVGSASNKGTGVIFVTKRSDVIH